MMKRIKSSAIIISFYLLGSVVPGISSVPLLNVSLIDTAHAARRAAHRSAHRTARPASRRTNVDVDVDRHGRHRSVDVDVDVRRGPSVGAVAVAAAIVVGTRVATLPRSCATVVTDDVTYHYCDGVYYRPYYEGTTVVYVVVDAP
jgi:hypothetical protein